MHKFNVLLLEDKGQATEASLIVGDIQLTVDSLFQHDVEAKHNTGLDDNNCPLYVDINSAIFPCSGRMILPYAATN